MNKNQRHDQVNHYQPWMSLTQSPRLTMALFMKEEELEAIGAGCTVAQEPCQVPARSRRGQRLLFGSECGVERSLVRVEQRAPSSWQLWGNVYFPPGTSGNIWLSHFKNTGTPHASLASADFPQPAGPMRRQSLPDAKSWLWRHCGGE